MDPERHARVKALFLAACELEPSHREAFLASASEDDALLRAEVDALLVQMTGAPTAAGLSVVPDHAALPPGSLLAGRYRIEAELGAGGMGRVYRATQLALSREVAVKILAAKAVGSPDALQRFEREAAAVARLRHPNIVTVYDAGTDERAGAFYAMELVEGRSLADELADRGVLPLAEAVEVMRQVTSAVGAAHKAGVIHRDLKPANVVLDRSAGLVAKVLDFGIAKLVDDDGNTTAAGMSLTASGAVFGTPLYMSPEQACAEHVDARTDVWSLAVMLYELVAGAPPFRGKTPAETFVAILKAEPEPLDRAASGVPESLATLISRALRKDPSERPETATEFEQSLVQIAGGLEQESTVETIQMMDARATANESARAATPKPASADTSVLADAPAPAVPPASGSGRRTAAIAAAVVLALTAGVAVAARLMARTASAPVAAPTSPTAPVATRSIAYAIDVQKYRDGAPYEAPFRLAKEVVFEKDYRIRLLVSSPDRGSLYVLNEAPPEVSAEPTFNVLFPSPTSNGGRSELAPGVEARLPERNWLRFDDERGTETLWLVWSETPIPELDGLARFVNPKDRGAITKASTARAVRDLLTANRPPVESSLDEAAKTTTLRAAGGVLVYKLRLEHQ